VKGVEPDLNLSVSIGNQHPSDPEAAKASVVLSPPLGADRDFCRIIDAWPTLPKPIRAAIMALINLDPEV
jgi:hypothetical protein